MKKTQNTDDGVKDMTKGERRLCSSCKRKNFASMELRY